MPESWMRLVIGVLAGGVWNLASLWCLAQLLQAWLGPQPSRRRVIVWLIVKFPLLYGLTFLLWRGTGVSLVGFSIGFSVVLVAAIAWLMRRAQRMVVTSSHGVR